VLLSLFLGSRANALTQAELARCVLRREHEQLKTAALLPRVRQTVTLQISDDPEIVRELMMLPDPIPVRDGGLGGNLIARGLLHQWVSSEAALSEAVRRRIARAYALVASLEAGRYPTEAELRTWIFDDGALQLGFPELLSAPTGDAATLLESVRIHASALERFRASHSTRSSLDIERADAIASLRTADPESKIVAFAQYRETVSMLFRRLAHLGGVAVLTAHGAQVAGGRLSRGEALSRFAPRALNARPPVSAERIDLLLSTDLLSEGVNLQDADVVVHLDIPWTAARLEQRVGRVARMGSAHSEVRVYLLRPPVSAAALMENEILVQRKWDVARRAVGSATAPPFPDLSSIGSDRAGESVTTHAENLRAILGGWRRSVVKLNGDEVCLASVSSSRPGFVAVVAGNGEPSMVVSLSGQVSNDLESQVAACRLGNGPELGTSSVAYEVAVRQLREWVERQSASALAGLADSRVLGRRRLVNRINTAIENAPPHSRGRRLTAAAKARRVATSPHSAAIESELESLGVARLSDDEWLAAVAKLDANRAVPGKSPSIERGLVIQALLLLSGNEHLHRLQPD
jgi:hypothetical protein